MRVYRQAGNSQFCFYFNTIVNYVTYKIVGVTKGTSCFSPENIGGFSQRRRNKIKGQLERILHIHTYIIYIRVLKP